MIDTIKDILINADISNVYVGWAGSLNIGIGKIHNPEEDKRFNIKTDWIFYSESASWRIIQQESIISGSYNQGESDEKIFPSYFYGKIIDVQMNTFKDITLILSNKIQIEFKNLNGLESNHDLYNLSNGKGIGFSLTINNNWISWSDKHSESENLVLENDKKIKEIALKSSSRWRRNYPKCKVNNCKDCIYFRNFNGPYEFWDFGACSSESSENDGLVKFREDTCSFFEPY